MDYFRCNHYNAGFAFHNACRINCVHVENYLCV